MRSLSRDLFGAVSREEMEMDFIERIFRVAPDNGKRRNHLQLKHLMGHSDFNTTLGHFKIREEKIAQGYFAAMEIYRPTPR
jgi:hypothetical protein